MCSQITWMHIVAALVPLIWEGVLDALHRRGKIPAPSTFGLLFIGIVSLIAILFTRKKEAE